MTNRGGMRQEKLLVDLLLFKYVWLCSLADRQTRRKDSEVARSSLKLSKPDAGLANVS